MIFHDRIQAALLLAEKLKKVKISDGIVLAIPRGGVPLGAIIARKLNVPLDLIMAKKIGHPRNTEFAVGSVTLHDVVLDDIATTLPEAYINTEIKRLRKDLARRYDYFSGGRKSFTLKGKDVIIVDDGLATGNTMLACIDGIRKQKPKSIIVAVPVASRMAANKVSNEADQFICLSIPSDFSAVGEFYEDFSEVSDQMVIDLLTNPSTNLVSL